MGAVIVSDSAMTGRERSVVAGRECGDQIGGFLRKKTSTL